MFRIMVKEFDSRVFSLYIATNSVCKFYIPPKMASTATLIYMPMVICFVQFFLLFLYFTAYILCLLYYWYNFYC